MKLVLLHGAPARGKLTVAKALLGLVPGRLIDNHAALDLALTVFDYDAPGFWDLVIKVRILALEAAAEKCIPLVVTTLCYSDPEDREEVAATQNVLKRHNGQLLPVFLYCSKEKADERVGNADRVARGKISTKDVLRKFEDEANLVPIPHPDCLSFDTGQNTPVEIARKIIARLDAGG